MAFPRKTTGSLRPALKVLSFKTSERFVYLTVKQTMPLHVLHKPEKVRANLPSGRLRYFLGGDLPSQTTSYTRFKN